MNQKKKIKPEKRQRKKSMVQKRAPNNALKQKSWSKREKEQSEPLKEIFHSWYVVLPGLDSPEPSGKSPRGINIGDKKEKKETGWEWIWPRFQISLSVRVERKGKERKIKKRRRVVGKSRLLRLNRRRTKNKERRRGELLASLSSSDRI